MKFEKMKQLSDKQFQRITGVKPLTFNKMVEIAQCAYDQAKEDATHPGGKPPKLCMADKVLMMLEYLREYRSYAHIDIVTVENVLG